MTESPGLYKAFKIEEDTKTFETDPGNVTVEFDKNIQKYLILFFS